MDILLRQPLPAETAAGNVIYEQEQYEDWRLIISIYELYGSSWAPCGFHTKH